MSVFITSEKFVNLDFPVLDSGTDYLMGFPGDKIKCTIDFYVKVSAENIAVITSENTSNNTIRRTDSGSFLKDGFRIGNSITTVGMGTDSANYTISDVSEKLITISSTLGTTTTYFSAFIYRTDLPISCDYYYNLIENDAPDSFVSLVDNQTTQRYTVSGISPTGTTGTFTIASNSKAWAVDGNGYGITIDGMGISDFKYYFRIIQTFIITPIALYSQLQNIQNGIPPAVDYFADRKCLRHIAKIDMKIEKTNPEIIDTATVSRKGNTGWFDEFLNGEDATYSATTPVYTFGGESVSEVQYSSTTGTNAVITLTSSNNTFTTGTTAVLHIIYIPATESDYINTASKFRHAFAYDRVTLTCGAGSSSGINNGTDDKQINLAAATFVNSSTITITCGFRMATYLESRVSEKDSDNRNYLVFVTTQNSSITSTTTTDRNAVIVDVNSYGLDLDDSTLFEINPNVKFYNFSDSLLGSQVNGTAGDIVRAVVPFQIKKEGQTITSIGVRIDAVYTGSTKTFTIEEWNADTSSFCLDDGVQEISITQNRGYRLPANHILNNITVSRNTSLDQSAGVRYPYAQSGYTLSYPFQLRYETWRTLENADCDFGDASQDWSVISNKPGWSIKTYITASVYDPDTDHTTDFEQPCIINVAPLGATGTTGTWSVITTYDNVGTNNQYGDILAEENTTVIADFYGSFLSLPTGTTGYSAILFLDQNTIGGNTWTYPFSSQEDLRKPDGNSPWISPTGGTGVCSIEIISSTHIQVKAKLDFTKLSPSINNYNLRAKLDYI
jgi:hypothetical protein